MEKLEKGRRINEEERRAKLKEEAKQDVEGQRELQHEEWEEEYRQMKKKKARDDGKRGLFALFYSLLRPESSSKIPLQVVALTKLMNESKVEKVGWSLSKFYLERFAFLIIKQFAQQTPAATPYMLFERPIEVKYKGHGWCTGKITSVTVDVFPVPFLTSILNFAVTTCPFWEPRWSLLLHMFNK